MTLPLTIEEAAAALRGGEVTSVELTEAALARLAALDGQVGAFLTVNESARAQAAEADANFAAGTDRGPLQGIPVGIKDLLATHDQPTTANSLIITWTPRAEKNGRIAIGPTTSGRHAKK